MIISLNHKLPDNINMCHFKYYIYSLILLCLLILTSMVTYDVVDILIHTKHGGWTWNLEMYKWMGIGIIAFFILSRVFNKNLKWFATFSHELTHTIVSLLLFRKIHSFSAGMGTGEITTSGNERTLVFVDLAPYCLPIFTYLLLAFRMMLVKDMLIYYDILIGLSIGFHVYCFRTQTGNYQTDINKHPLFFSYLYIATFLLFNFLVILVSYWHSKNVFTAFWYVIVQIWNTFHHFFLNFQ